MLLSILFSCVFVMAQENPNLEDGMKPFGTFHGGDIDSISMTNGGLSLQIPLLTYPERGNLQLQYFLRLNSKTWSQQWVPLNTPTNGYYKWKNNWKDGFNGVE